MFVISQYHALNNSLVFYSNRNVSLTFIERQRTICNRAQNWSASQSCIIFSTWLRGCLHFANIDSCVLQVVPITVWFVPFLVTFSFCKT